VSGVSVALALAWRQLTILRKNPSLFLPPMLFPLMNFMAFAGGLSRLRHVPGFAYPNGYTAFQFVFVLLQSAAFGGVFTGFSIARDFEQGFARRLLVASPSRRGLVAGYAIAAGIRWLLIALVLTIVALIARMQIGGSGLDLFGVYGLALLCNVAGVMWAMGIAMRVRSVQAGPLMQTPVFMLLFLAPVYVPLELLQGWIHAVASVNPVTFVLSTNRSLLAGEPEHVFRGVAITLALVGFFVLWAIRGLRVAERAG
jgi:ABC-2 type transport system permease protein